MPPVSCAWPLCRLLPSTASAVTSICSGGKPDKLCLRWSRCGVAGESRAAQPFHLHSGGESPAPYPTSLGDYSREQRRARRALLAPPASHLSRNQTFHLPRNCCDLLRGYALTAGQQSTGESTRRSGVKKRCLERFPCRRTISRIREVCSAFRSRDLIKTRGDRLADRIPVELQLLGNVLDRRLPTALVQARRSNRFSP